MRLNVTADADFRTEVLNLVRNNIKPAVQDIVESWLPGQLEKVLDNWLAKVDRNYKTNLQKIIDELKQKIEKESDFLRQETRSLMHEKWVEVIETKLHEAVEKKIQELTNLDERISLGVRAELARLGQQPLPSRKTGPA